MEIVKKLIIDTKENIQKYLSNVKVETNSIKSFDIKWNENEILDLIEKTGKVKGPTLYWFEIVSKIENEVIINSLRKYSREKDAKKTPVESKKSNDKSKILYVGKVKENFTRRFKQHLGEYPAKTTQGLQLQHWAKEIDLRLNYFEFDENMKDLLAVFEIELANQLKPILGIHK